MQRAFRRYDAIIIPEQHREGSDQIRPVLFQQESHYSKTETQFSLSTIKTILAPLSQQLTCFSVVNGEWTVQIQGICYVYCEMLRYVCYLLLFHVLNIDISAIYIFNKNIKHRSYCVLIMISGPRLNITMSFSGMGIPMLKIRRSRNRLIFNVGIPILVRRHLYIQTAPASFVYKWK